MLLSPYTLVVACTRKQPSAASSSGAPREQRRRPRDMRLSLEWSASSGAGVLNEVER